MAISTCVSVARTFFPPDVFGSPNKKSGLGSPITLNVGGLDREIQTDIPTDRISGRPRWIFRERGWARAFVRSNKLRSGDLITISRLARRTYSVLVDGLSRSSRIAKCLETRLEESGLPKVTNDRAVECTKESWIQPTFAPLRRKGQPCDYGTFKDSLNAPIHRWFKYPAGYSYRLVEEKIRHYRLAARHLLLDPFIGCGTTCVEAKRHGVNSIGIEAHPFVRWVAQTKVNWEIPIVDVVQTYQNVVHTARAMSRRKG